MKNKCPQCHLVNFEAAASCDRCNAELDRSSRGRERGMAAWLALRALVLMTVIVIIIAGFYVSLVGSAKRLTIEEQESVRRSIRVLQNSGFASESFLLSNFTAFRGSDHWLNAAVAKENAYAATNFPFMIMTLYSDFFTYPVDEVERAAILLHEARHLKGEGEKEAYEFVWRNRHRLGWTKENYQASPVWVNIREQTRDHAPELFTCGDKEFLDCTE